MHTLCGKLLTSVVILPFTAGNYRTRRNGSRYYDGAISFRVLFLCVVALIIVFSATKIIHQGADIRLGIVLLLLSILITSCIAVCLIFVCIAQARGLQCVVAARRHTHTTKLQVGFLWIFGLASSLFAAFLVIKMVQCSVHVTGGLYWNTIICFNFVLVACFLCEMIFITYFASFKLKRSIFVNYSMQLLLSANICTLLYVSIIGNAFNTFTAISHDANISICLSNNSTMLILIEKSSSILTPMFTEFVLLSSTVIIEIWSPSDRQNNEHMFSEMNDIMDSERSYLLPYVPTSESVYLGNRRKLYQIITVIASLITGFGLVIMYVAMAMDLGNVPTFHYIADLYELILKVLMIGASFVGFFCLVNYCTPDGSSRPLKGRENVYLLSVFGLIMLHVCKAIQGGITSYLNSNFLLYANVVSIFQDYLQVVFLLHANRCKKSDPRSNLWVLESVLIFTTIINFALWINDTFLLSQYPITQVMTKGQFSQGILKLGGTILLPVSVFYRFTSFLEYFATFRDYAS